ncbi:MAG: thiamine-phosphate kinase [Caulobacteraceae bacterium]
MTDEFERIARLFRPLTEDAPEAFGLLDDAAAIPSRPGQDLIVTKDAVVEGVHFLAGDPPDLVARKLLRVNLSDLAAKGAEPYAYFLAVAWPPRWDEAMCARFADGLAEDQARYGIRLLGGDTVSTPGPFTASLTALGWTASGHMVRRSGAGAGDVLMVSGVIGDGALGLEAAKGGLDDLAPSLRDALASRYRLPNPRVDLIPALRAHASAAADVSDGLVADAGHIADASGLGFELDLGALPLSNAASAWLSVQADAIAARTRLATGGDDYEVVCTAAPAAAEALTAAGFTAVGRMTVKPGRQVIFEGEPIATGSGGWRHS